MEFGIFIELSVPRPWTPETERQVYANALEQCGWPTSWASTTCGRSSTTSSRSTPTARRPRSVPHGVRHADRAHPGRPRDRGLRARDNQPDPHRRAGRRARHRLRRAARASAPAAAPPGPSSAASAPIPTRPRRRGTSSSGSCPRCGCRSGSAGRAGLLHARAGRPAQAGPEAASPDVGGGDQPGHRDRRGRHGVSAVWDSPPAGSRSPRRRSTPTAPVSRTATRSGPS